MQKNFIQSLKTFFQKPENLFVFSSIFLFFALLLLTFIDFGIFYQSLLLIGSVSFLWWASYKYTSYIIFLLIFWFAFENLLLKYIGQDFALYIKYIPELILYITFVFILVHKAVRGQLQFIKTPINSLLALFVIVGFVSILVNGVPLVTGLLGMRQILRFVVLFYLILYAHITRKDLKKMVILVLSIGIFQILVAILQWLTNGAFDQYLLLEETFYIGETFEIQGTDSLWLASKRVFGTFKRYNELGAFLTLLVPIFIAWKYQYKKISDDKTIVFWLASLGLGFVILLTYARSTWIAAIAVMVVMAFWIRRDKVFTKYFLATAAVLLVTLFLYISYLQVNVNTIRDVQSATLPERILQTFSATELRGSYDGFGRLYFLVNTPKVVALSPLIGVGPGMYGGGVAAALQNKQVYDEAGIVFGVFGNTGQIDNNWFSIWGEFGTFGVLVFFLILIRLYKYTQVIYKNSREKFVKMMSFALQGMTVAFLVLGLFGPYFEIRTLSFYFWLYAGVVLALGSNISEEQYHRITSKK